MTTPPHVVAESSGIAVVEQGGTLWVVDRKTGWVSTAIFVTGLNAGIGLLGGFALLFTVGWAGLIPMLFGGLGVVGLMAILRWKRTREAAPLTSLPVLCALDPNRRAVTDASGQAFASFEQVELKRAFQVASSSPALELVHPGGKILLVRGNPFGGGIDDVEHVLRQQLSAQR